MEHELRRKFRAASSAPPYYEPVEVDGIGTIYVKRLTAGEKDKVESSKDVGNRSLALLHGCFDERGIKLFGDDDQLWLETLDASLIDPIVKVFMRINRYSKEDQEELLKNSNGQAVTS